MVCHFWGEFYIALDRCRVMIHGRENFPFYSELSCLLFERLLKKRPTFSCQNSRPMNQVWMHMWGEMMPKRGQLKFSSRISTNTLGIPASEENHMFIMVMYHYVGLDWRGCLNILFTPSKTTNPRDNITIFF
jgi:hypothetical protein